MRIYIFFTFLFVFMIFDGFSQDLKEYRWKHRILLLCEKDESLPQSAKQISYFADYAGEMEERKLLILIAQGDLLRDRDQKILKENAGSLLKKGFQGVLLIGLDGGIKWESEFYAQPSEIFEIIESMPMRRAEIRGKYDP